MGHQYISPSLDGNVLAVLGDVQNLHLSNKGVEDNERRKTVADWFSRTDFADQQTDHISRREQGTGHWFLAHPDYQHWRDHADSTLFCPGIPGSGKSMMVATIVDDLQTFFDMNAGVAVVYMYCNFNRQAEQSFEHMLAVLIRQLFQERTELPEPVRVLYEKHQRRATRPSEEELKYVLRHLTELYDRVFIVIDALDECQNDCLGRDRLLTELFYLQRRESGNINILATSRHIPEIKRRFSECQNIEIRAHNDDLEVYVTNRMAELARFVLQNKALQKQIKSQIVEASEGMFLLTKLQFDSLGDKLTPRKLKDALAGLAKGFNGLDNAYNDAMNRINHQRDGYRETARRALMWIVYARKELAIEELQEAIAIELGLQDLDHNEDLTSADDIVSACQGLVEVDQESRIIRLVHYTTQEYFEKTREKWLPNGDLEILRSCMVYLSMSVFPHDECEWEICLTSLVRKYKLLEYAAKNWGVHARKVDDKQVCNEILRFLGTAGYLRFASQLASATWIFDDSKYYSEVLHWSIAHLCAYFGLKQTLQKMIEENNDVDSLDQQSRTPLFLAVINGHREAALLLLAHADVKVNICDRYGETPLYISIVRGYTEIVQLLLEQPNIEVNFHGLKHEVALSCAAKRGYTEIVRLLVARSDVNDTGQPLLLAVIEGNTEIVQLLLTRSDLNINAQAFFDRTALCIAVLEGHIQIVRLLLTRSDINVNVRDKSNETAISLAAERGHTEIVRLLLTRSDLEVNIQDRDSMTALAKGAWRGYTEIVQLLLARSDISVNMQDKHGRTALAWASWEGHAEIVRLLLTRSDVDVNAQDRNCPTALILACRPGHIEVVQLLLARSEIDVNVQNKYGNTALSIAAKKQLSRGTYIQTTIGNLQWVTTRSGKTSRVLTGYEATKPEFSRTAQLIARLARYTVQSDYDYKRALSTQLEGLHLIQLIILIPAFPTAL